jgi:hypothetical protein
MKLRQIMFRDGMTATSVAAAAGITTGHSLQFAVFSSWLQGQSSRGGHKAAVWLKRVWNEQVYCNTTKSVPLQTHDNEAGTGTTSTRFTIENDFCALDVDDDASPPPKAQPQAQLPGNIDDIGTQCANLAEMITYLLELKATGMRQHAIAEEAAVNEGALSQFLGGKLTTTAAVNTLKKLNVWRARRLQGEMGKEGRGKRSSHTVLSSAPITKATENLVVAEIEDKNNEELGPSASTTKHKKAVSTQH